MTESPTLDKLLESVRTAAESCGWPSDRAALEWLASALPGMIEDAASVPALKAKIAELSRVDWIQGEHDEYSTPADDLQIIADNGGEPGTLVEVRAYHDLPNHFIAIIPADWNESGKVTYCDYKLFADSDLAYAAIESAAAARKASLTGSDASVGVGETPE